jgi:hypothetical protein
MIVKIRKPANLGYIVYDNIVHFDYSRYAWDYPIAISIEGDDYTSQCLGCFDSLTEDQITTLESSPEFPDKIYLFLQKKNGETKQVLAHGTVFILNDEGKTIDKF